MHQIKLHPTSNEIVIAKGESQRPLLSAAELWMSISRRIHLFRRIARGIVETSVPTASSLATWEPLKGTDAIAKPTLRSAVVRENSLALPSGKSAFHFLLPINGIPADPVTAQLAAKAGSLQVWMVEDKRMVTYPYRYNPLRNFVCLCPDTGDGSHEEGSPPPQPGVCINLAFGFLTLIGERI